jgi:hypothetical protein
MALRARVAIAEQRNEAVCRAHFRRGPGEFAAQKTGVVAWNQDRLPPEDRRVGPPLFGLKVLSDPLSGGPDIFKGEIARDQPAPAAGSKLDSRHGLSR